MERLLKVSPHRSNWSLVRNILQIGTGDWDDCRFLFFMQDSDLYAVRQNKFVKLSSPTRGSGDDWIGSAETIGSVGWSKFKFLMSSVNGRHWNCAACTWEHRLHWNTMKCNDNRYDDDDNQQTNVNVTTSWSHDNLISTTTNQPSPLTEVTVPWRHSIAKFNLPLRLGISVGITHA